MCVCCSELGRAWPSAEASMILSVSLSLSYVLPTVFTHPSVKHKSISADGIYLKSA